MFTVINLYIVLNTPKKSLHSYHPQKYLPKCFYPKKSWNGKFQTQKNPSHITVTFYPEHPPAPSPSNSPFVHPVLAAAAKKCARKSSGTQPLQFKKLCSEECDARHSPRSCDQISVGAKSNRLTIFCVRC